MKQRFRTVGIAALTALFLTWAAAAAQPAAVSAQPADSTPESSSEVSWQAAPPSLATGAEVERQVRFRKDLGFQSDEAYVRSLVESPGDHGAIGFLGLHLTPEEHATLQERLEVQRHLPLIQRYGREQAPETFATVYTDHQAGGVVRVLFTSDLAAHETAIQRFFPYPERLSFHLAEHSLAELKETVADVIERRRALQRAGIAIRHADVDEIGGRVIIGVEGATPDVQAQLAVEFGANRVDVVESVEEHEDQIDRGRENMANSDPIRGGLATRTNAGSDRCTTGFVAFAWIAGTRTHFTMTAGHCWALGNTVRQGQLSAGSWRRIGEATRRNNQDASDVAAIPHNHSFNTSRWIYVHPNARAYAITRTRALWDESLGDVVCMAGKINPGTTTAHNCGTITSRIHAPSGPYCACFRRATYARSTGDSGAPVYERDPQGSWAHGIHKGGHGNEAVYTHIHHALADLNLDGIRNY